MTGHLEHFRGHFGSRVFRRIVRSRPTLVAISVVEWMWMTTFGAVLGWAIEAGWESVVSSRAPRQSCHARDNHEEHNQGKIKGAIAMLTLPPLLVLQTSQPRISPPMTQGEGQGRYVCACLKNKSCSQKREAKTEAHAPARGRRSLLKVVPQIAPGLG